MTELPYYKLPDPPEEMNAANLLIRLVDTLGFRYRWATEGLREVNMEFQPCDSSMTLGDLMEHLYNLIAVTDTFITGQEHGRGASMTLEERRKTTLDILVSLREKLHHLNDDYLEKRRWFVPWGGKEYPIWFLINGPLSDALTHVGQVASWRRINGNPILGANVFFGTPPKKLPKIGK
jgi:hypothetical protein